MLAFSVRSTRLRLDQALLARGLAPTRARAQALIMAGLVRVDGRCVDKPGASVPSTAVLELSGPDHPWVSRGGVKLAAALAAFNVDPRGKNCLDVGASTGGFTDVLLAGGAARVTAVDVGRGQLDERLRADPRVVVRDGINARFLTARDVDAPFDLIVVDVSFISLRLVLPALVPLLAPVGEVVALVKPQFEAGRRQVGKGGVVRDAAVREAAIAAVLAAAESLGLRCCGRLPSPLPGPAGNVEELVHLRSAQGASAQSS